MKAYLIGGEYDLTILNVRDDRTFIYMHSMPDVSVVVHPNPISEVMATILTYRIFARTEDGRVMYEFVKGE